MKITIQKSEGESLPVGTHNATFRGVESTETSKGDANRWMFETDGGKHISPNYSPALEK